MNNGIQITARRIDVTRGDPSIDASLEIVEVHLSAAPSPRWQACFQVVANDGQGLLWRERPLFDQDVIKLVAVRGQTTLLQQEIPDLLSSANRLSYAQGLMDSQ